MAGKGDVVENEKIRAMRVVDRAARLIDYRLNILGIRVWENACQLIAMSWGGGVEPARAAMGLAGARVPKCRRAKNGLGGHAAPDGVSIQCRAAGVRPDRGAGQKQGF